MADIREWSNTAAGNDRADPGPPDFPAEGQTRASLNNCARENMAAVRRWYEDGGWADWGDTYVYVSSTSFQVTNVDATSRYRVGRRVRAVGTSTGTIYGEITGSTYSAPNTVVTVAWDSGSLQNETLIISIGTDDRAVPAPLISAGMIIMWGGTFVPAGWLRCDGASYATTSYPNLFSIIGYTFGGAGASFSVPDFRNRSAVGVGPLDGTGTASNLGDKQGVGSFQLSLANLPVITGRDPALSINVNGASPTVGVADDINKNLGGSAAAFQLRSPQLCVEFIIKF